MALGRLYRADIPIPRLLSIVLGASALLEDDYGLCRTEEYRRVTIAKVCHRLASGTHTVYGQGTGSEWKRSVYPMSSGLVLRKLGGLILTETGHLLPWAIPEIIRLKTEASGEHPSHRSTFRP
jgi:hypothetical protein